MSHATHQPTDQEEVGQAMSVRETTVSDAERRTVEGNINLGFDFVSAAIDDPSLLDGIPQGATLVLLPEDDPDLTETNLGIAVRAAREGKTVVIRPAVSPKHSQDAKPSAAVAAPEPSTR